MANFFAQNLRYFCAIFFLQTFALFLRMKLLFLRNLRKNRKYFLRKLRMKRNFSLRNCFAQFAQNRKFYAKCNFLGKLSKIDILSLELNN